MTAAIYGLVLAGGASRRMQTDKAALLYAGRTQLQRAFELLEKVCARTFISVRKDQVYDATRSSFPQIIDVHDDLGPLAGISAAQLAHPDAAWLILACDLPFINEDTLRYLLQHRDPSRIATAYRSSHDQLPEPLCTIWEPSSSAPINEWINKGQKCPRKLLINSDAALLALPDANTLDNVNTPDEHLHALKAMSTRPLSLHVQYFALFREQAGKREELLETVAATPALLYAELRQRYGFKLNMNQLKVAINNEFAEWQTSLKSNDRIAFIPPVAGG